MKKYLKRVAFGLTVLGIGASTAGAFAADHTDCFGGFVASIADSISCNQQDLSFANTATSTRVRVNLVRLTRRGKTSVVNQGLNSQLSVIPGCRVSRGTGGTQTSANCSQTVAFHIFQLL